MQVAQDGKIYISTYVGGYYISSINIPNDTGVSCNYTLNSVYLGGKLSYDGLPTFMQNYFFIPDFNARILLLWRFE